MKKLVVLLLCSVPLVLFAQDNDYTMYQTIEIVPDNKTLDKLNKAVLAYEEKDKSHREVEADIAALTRR